MSALDRPQLVYEVYEPSMVRTSSSSSGVLVGRSNKSRRDINPGRQEAMGDAGSDGICSPSIDTISSERLSFARAIGSAEGTSGEIFSFEICVSWEVAA